MKYAPISATSIRRHINIEQYIHNITGRSSVKNEVKYNDLRRKIEIKKMTNLIRNKIIYAM